MCRKKTVKSIKREKKIRAVGLLSGGLDSTLATRLLLDQEIDVHAINFTSPFCLCTPKSAGCAAVVTAVRGLGNIPLKQVALKDEYLEMVRHPRHGYGSGMNPCIDCRIMKIKKAGEFMRKIGASFLFTGEVLGQRPMSQHRQAIDIIDRDSGLHGYILRPLSAALFEPTIPEVEGWVQRDRFLGISGRSRKPQMALAAEKGISDYPCPAGGCLLTDKNFAHKLSDYFRFQGKPTMRDIPLLRVGRHFRLENGDKIIVARDEEECKRLTNLCRETEHLFVPSDFTGPVVILQGESLKTALEKMLRYTKRSVNKSSCVDHLFMGKSETVTMGQYHVL